MHDLIIKNGLIADGTGAPAFQGDVAVDGGMIVAVGKVSGPARRTLDADGLMVTPGFVDIHTHYDGQVSWDSVLAPSSINGVTSIAMGNCGVGFAPAHTDKHAWLISLLEGVEDIPGTALAEGLKWDWESFPDYLNAIARRSYTLDLGAHMPHAALRAYVMGERGADHTIAPTDDEIARMEGLTFEALEAGAIGFSTSRTYLHRSREGQFDQEPVLPRLQVNGDHLPRVDGGRAGVVDVEGRAVEPETDFIVVAEVDGVGSCDGDGETRASVGDRFRPFHDGPAQERKRRSSCSWQQGPARPDAAARPYRSGR